MLWAKKPQRLPVVLTKEEVQAVMEHLSGEPRLIVQLLYGGGLRVNECLRLRVKDVDFGQGHIMVRDGKGFKDRTTTLPQTAVPALRRHLEKVKKRHYEDLEKGYGRVSLPNALAEKYPQADTEWQWQYVFPSKTLSTDPRSEDETLYRHHLHPSSVQKAVKKAAQKNRNRQARDAPHLPPQFLLPICWKPAMIFARFKNCWGIKMSRRR